MKKKKVTVLYRTSTNNREDIHRDVLVTEFRFGAKIYTILLKDNTTHIYNLRNVISITEEMQKDEISSN